MYRDEISVRLETGSDGPFHFVRIMNIDILIHDNCLLNVVVGAEGGHQHVFSLARFRFIHLDNEVVATHAAHREVDVLDAGEVSLQTRKNRCFARDRAQ